MKQQRQTFAAIVALAFGVQAGSQSADLIADLVFHGGSTLTVNELQPATVAIDRFELVSSRWCNHVSAPPTKAYWISNILVFRGNGVWTLNADILRDRTGKGSPPSIRLRGKEGKWSLVDGVVWLSPVNGELRASDISIEGPVVRRVLTFEGTEYVACP